MFKKSFKVNCLREYYIINLKNNLIFLVSYPLTYCIEKDNKNGKVATCSPQIIMLRRFERKCYLKH